MVSSVLLPALYLAVLQGLTLLDVVLRGAYKIGQKHIIGHL